PAVATVDLTGQTVVEVASVGKHMLARTDAGLTLHSHFKMEGSWHVYRHGQKWRGGPTHEVRAILENEDWVIVGYRLPVLEVIETRDEANVVGHLGPDILSPHWDEQEALRRILSQPDRSVAEALLDQRNVAGIGNLYKNESLFLAGADPWGPSSKLDVLKILRIAHRLMSANVDHWSQTTTGNTRPGFRHWVFERKGQPCRRCGSSIQAAEQGTAPVARLTYRCRWCQPPL
ncbi:MAG TPA: DNA-formamidopyrimidine glycosylase family protein, partial [Actinomycetota bacterium]|nr:DNA-formamidopyrimidine glycosylase family protein [Actinomycetota bacterium]